MGFQEENENYKNFHLISSLTNSDHKTFQKTWKSIFIMTFSTDMGLDFLYLSQKKSNTYISGERWADTWRDRQKTDILLKHHTTDRSNKPSRQWLFLKILFWPKP